METLTSLVKIINFTDTFYKIFSLEDKPSDIIQNKFASNLYSKDTLISNIPVDNDAQLFEIPRNNNYSITAPGAHILVGFDDDW